MLASFALTLPLFLIVFIGYALVRLGTWTSSTGEVLSHVVMTAAMPAMLFVLMCGVGTLPDVDYRLLIAFFGGSFVVFALARVLAWRMFHLDGVQQSVFALGGIFSNNLLLGVPMARLLVGDQVLPPVTLILIFNTLVFLTLTTASVEWARHGTIRLRDVGTTLLSMLRNPVIVSILAGASFGLSGFTLPGLIKRALDMVSATAAPLALIALGAGLANVRVRAGLSQASAVVLIKLLVHPLVVLALARLIALPELETQAAVLLASLALGVTVPVVAMQIGSLQGVMSSALVISTVAAALTTPLWLVLAFH